MTPSKALRSIDKGTGLHPKRQHQDLTAKPGSAKDQVMPSDSSTPETRSSLRDARVVQSDIADTERHEAIRKRFIERHPLPTFTREQISAIVKEHVREEEQKHQ